MSYQLLVSSNGKIHCLTFIYWFQLFQHSPQHASSAMAALPTAPWTFHATLLLHDGASLPFRGRFTQVLAMACRFLAKPRPVYARDSALQEGEILPDAVTEHGPEYGRGESVSCCHLGRADGNQSYFRYFALSL